MQSFAEACRKLDDTLVTSNHGTLTLASSAKAEVAAKAAKSTVSKVIRLEKLKDFIMILLIAQ